MTPSAFRALGLLVADDDRRAPRPGAGTGTCAGSCAGTSTGARGLHARP